MRFEKLTVASRREETPELTLLRVEGGADEIYDEHTCPGQYAALRLPEAEHPGYMAIASPPGARHLEFLVRGGGRFADTLRRLGPGDTVEVSRPLGPGFPLVEARGRNVWLVGVGSGIAALRPVVEVLLAEPEAWGKLHLIFGTRGPGHIPFLEDLERWRQRGIDVILTASRAHDGEAWSGHRGYVQDLLLHLAPEMGEAVIFACGMPSMIESVRGAAAKLGLDPGRVITNTVREES